MLIEGQSCGWWCPISMQSLVRPISWMGAIRGSSPSPPRAQATFIDQRDGLHGRAKNVRRPIRRSSKPPKRANSPESPSTQLYSLTGLRCSV